MKQFMKGEIIYLKILFYKTMSSVTRREVASKLYHRDTKTQSLISLASSWFKNFRGYDSFFGVIFP
jgi:hypothetical protein